MNTKTKKVNRARRAWATEVNAAIDSLTRGMKEISGRVTALEKLSPLGSELKSEDTAVIGQQHRAILALQKDIMALLAEKRLYREKLGLMSQ